MPGKPKKNNKKKTSNKKIAEDKKTKNARDGISCLDVKVGDVVTFDVKSVIISNIQNNNEIAVKNYNIESARINESNKENLCEKMSNINLDNAFIDDNGNNNNEETSNLEQMTKTMNEANTSSPPLRTRTLSRRDCRTVQDFVDAGVPRYIAEMKHPLATNWTFWYHGNKKSLTWDQNQTAITSVSTVEDFWKVLNYLKLASKLEPGCDYCVFRAGVRPDWEDLQNCGGGRWHIASNCVFRESGQLDTWWTEILLILIGGEGQHANLVNGAVVNIKTRQDKLAVWISDSKDMTGVMEIGRLIKRRLGLGDHIKIVFSVHSDDKKKMRTGSGSSPGKISL